LDESIEVFGFEEVRNDNNQFRGEAG
jgi:hypothetical protein